MSRLYKNKFKTESMRLKKWDYSQNGFYFVTICTNNHQLFFGDVEKSGTEYFPTFEMKLSPIGKLAQKYWLEITKHFSNVKLDEFVIMPNHLHGIIEICENVVIDKEVCRVAIDRDLIQGELCGDMNANRDAMNRASTDIKMDSISTDIKKDCISEGGATGKNNPMGKNSLGKVIRWYKGRCTFEINKIIENKNFSWQSKYYDHIVRDENSLNEIRKYIVDNPAKWDLDKNVVENFYE